MLMAQLCKCHKKRKYLSFTIKICESDKSKDNNIHQKTKIFKLKEHGSRLNVACLIKCIKSDGIVITKNRGSREEFEVAGFFVFSQ